MARVTFGGRGRMTSTRMAGNVEMGVPGRLVLERGGSGACRRRAGSDLGREAGTGAGRGGRAVSRRCRGRRGASRGGGRAPGRRAVRVADPRGRGHHHRSGPHRRPDDLRRQRGRDAGQGHRVRRADDHHQRDRRVVAAARLAALRRDAVQRGGRRGRTGHGHHGGHAEPGPAGLHHRASGQEFTSSQLAFAAIATLLVYLLFVFTQTVRHRDFFLPIAQRAKSACSRTRATRIRPAGGRR